MTIYLTMMDKLGNMKKVELQKPLYSLGRQADSDIMVLGASVSRRHAEILQEGEEYFLVDCASKTGSYINGEKISRHKLRPGDKIRLGGSRESEIQFLDSRYDTAAEAPARSSLSMSAQAVNARAELQNLARFLEVNQALKISLPLDEVLRLIVDAAIEITRAERGALLLCDNGGKLELRVARDRERRNLAGAEFPISRTVLDQVYRDGRSQIFADCLDGGGPVGSESVMRLDLRTIICIPLTHFQMKELGEATGMHMRKTIGVLYVDSRQAVGTLTRTSVSLLESLAFEASKALESIRLMQQEEEKRKIEQELATAREVQDALLSMSHVDTGYAEIAASSIPCRFVGGDFFDLFPMEGDRAALVLADVAGKGISAALLAAMAQGVLYTQLRADQAPAAVVTNLNRLLLAKSSSWRFITLFCGVLERSGRFTYINGGHNPPMLLRKTGELELLSSGSMVVGAWGPAVYEEVEKQLFPGDVLVAFTDGITEAEDAAGDMFGDRRLEDCIRSLPDLDAVQIRDRIHAEVTCFTGQAPQHDDITVVVLKMKNQGSIRSY